jgi:hypothetical protein
LGVRSDCWAIAILGLLCAPHGASAQTLTPSDVFMSAYHAPRLGNAGVAQTRANAFTIMTNGVVDRGGVDRIDTFIDDNLGGTFDFVGLQYANPNRFDAITVELGNQFGDGGDWDSQPKVYILKNPTLVGDTVEPNLSANWVEVTGAVETTGHVFSPLVVPGPGGTVRLDLSSIPAANRTGYGWAVGGVDGNANGSGVINFISLTEAFATGAPAAAPVPAPPATPRPVNVIANAINSVGRNGDGIDNWRGEAFASLTNGLLDRDVGLGNDGFDTFQGDVGGTQTDFVGLQYGAIYRFDSLTVELGNQFADGGDWEATPKIYILKNPIDTNNTRPETDPANWLEVTGAVETTGHAFSPIVTPGPGGTINFNLNAIPAAQRSGYGWAIGGVDGNQNEAGVINFISVTELAATGALVPGPYNLKLQVNTTTGVTSIVNSSPFNVSLDFYEITSTGDALNVAGWNNLQSPAGNPPGFPSGNGTGNGWEQLGNLDSGIVAEAYLQGSSTLATGGSASLGSLFTVGGAQDLAFRYRTASGAFIDAVVEYISGGFLAADFNHDHTVNAADLTVWRGAFGTSAAGDADADGDSDGNDFLVWQCQLGMTGAAAAQNATPEPATGLLVLGAAVAGAIMRRRASLK